VVGVFDHRCPDVEPSRRCGRGWRCPAATTWRRGGLVHPSRRPGQRRRDHV